MLLCSVHTARYFREKVLTGKAYWGDISCKNFLNGKDKDDIMNQTMMVRDAPSQELYNQREEKLFQLTRTLSIRPGQAAKPVLFKDYYMKNWKKESFRWVFAYHKNLPTQGTNDTQASESTFRAIKHYSKCEFGNRTPTLSELVKVLPAILDQRSVERDTASRRLVFRYPENKHIDLALEVGLGFE